ncbi:MAG: SpoIIE family protein phosphatase [Gordonia paraffinivorans]
MNEKTRSALAEMSSALIDRHVMAAAEVARQLTFAQLGVVAQIRGVDHTTISAIAEHADVAVSTASRWVDRLEALGLATREPVEGSRREIAVTLSPLGESVASRWDAARVAIWRDLLGGLDDPTVATIVDSMHAALGTARSEEPEPASGDTLPILDDPASFIARVSRALSTAAPDDHASTLVGLLSETLRSTVVLRIATHDGRHLNTLALAHPSGVVEIRGRDDIVESDETVDRSPPGDSFRAGHPVVDAEARWSLHVPVTTATHRVGTLTVTLDAPPDADAPVRDLVQAAADTAAPHLATPKSPSRRAELASRSRSWTVGAEIQSRQLGPPRTVAHGITVAARIEPAYNTCTDSYDIEVVAADGAPAVDVAVLDSGVDRYSAPLVTGLALGAVRHARAQGWGPAEQARLLDEAVFGHFRGQAVVNFLLLRIDCASRACDVVASSSDIDLVHHTSSPHRVELQRSDAAGLTGEGESVTEHLQFTAGDRIAIMGDGFAARSALGRRAELVMGRSRSLSVDEVVRQVGVDLLDRTGADGPPDDATIVCIDL